MTIKFEKTNVFDSILGALGKRRGVVIPKGVYQKYGPYVYAVARRESFWKALVRSKNAPMPEGVMDADPELNG